MNKKSILIEKINNIIILKFNRPKKFNALNYDVLKLLYNILYSLKQNKSIKGIIFTGVNQKSFIAGADISELSKQTSVQSKIFSSLGHSVFNLIQNMHCPTISIINSYALGGGLELALSCDIIYADSSAKLGLVETSLGLIPGFGGTYRLNKKIGTSLSSELISSAKIINATYALSINLINKIIEKNNSVQSALIFFDLTFKNSSFAITLNKKIFQSIDYNSLNLANLFDIIAFSFIFLSHDYKTGVTNFLHKKNKKYRGI